MPIPFEYSFPRYLAAKKSVDDRALNRHVWETLRRSLPPASPAPLRVLEVGAGIGTMLERLLEGGLLSHARYTALDALPENIAAARSRLSAWAGRHGYWAAETPVGLQLERSGLRVEVALLPVDLFDFLRERSGQSWDLIIAHAFLDLMDIPATLPRLFSLLRPGGLFYFSLNFNGLTVFEPPLPQDERILAAYHRSMDERLTDGKPSGDSRAGRHLFAHLQNAGAHILDVGASDWVVYPRPGGVITQDDPYPDDEAYFLYFILHFFEESLSARPDVPPGDLAAWLAARRFHVERGELVYIAHQLDFVGSFNPPAGSEPAGGFRFGGCTGDPPLADAASSGKSSLLIESLVWPKRVAHPG
jgi:SAM-dependent methyltransferase